MITGTPKQLIPALLELDQEKIYELKEKKQKRKREDTTPTIPVWSPTTVLGRPHDV